MAQQKRRADRIGEHRTAFEKNRQIILKTQDICGICGQKVDKTIKYPDPMSPTIDHIVPVNKGGHPSALENLQLAHRWCNRQKSDKFFNIKLEKDKHEKDTEINNNDLPWHYDWRGYKS